MTWQVVGCSSCHGLWLVEDLRTTDTMECPLCDTTHQTETLKVQYEADSRDMAVETRARLLAERAGEVDNYQSVIDAHGQYGDQRREVDASVGAVTVTLPAPAEGATVGVERTDASSNDVTVAPNGAENVNYGGEEDLVAQGESVDPLSGGTDWFGV